MPGAVHEEANDEKERNCGKTDETDEQAYRKVKQSRFVVVLVDISRAPKNPDQETKIRKKHSEGDS